MSCTENESGPFVVFLLPAVVGCLTILLARRWVYTQVSNPVSTGISRRRKIIKDPLVKRTLPPLACKMVAPGRKSGAMNKKVTSHPDDDMNGKRTRARVVSASPSVLETKTEGPPPPKHIPFPYIPQDGELLFEVMTFVFTLVATGLQYLNLYRTVWWLPNSYTTQAMNFYLIDAHVVAFIVTIISRRFLLSLTVAVLKCILPENVVPHATNAARMFILGVVLGALAWCTYFITLKYPLIKIFFLCYPVVIYVLLFGFQSAPFLELNNSDTPLLHCCSSEPEQVRAEVELLRNDFNLRAKKILFNSVAGAYYTSFVPCCFAQSFVYYDVYAAAQQVGLAWGALCGRYAAQLLPAAACDVPHRAARHLGRWQPCQPAPAPPAPPAARAEGEGEAEGEVAWWSGERWWAGGARARYGPRVFLAAAPLVAADPTDPSHRRFYAVFSNPSTFLCLLLCLQLALVLVQLCLLFSSITWHYFLSIIMLLFINYYTLFKMVRDYLVAWKVYKAENMIQDKNMQAVN